MIETDATLARRDEALAVMRSLQESLQEPLFMKALVWLVSANSKDEKCQMRTIRELQRPLPIAQAEKAAKR